MLHDHHLLSLDFRRCADDGKFVLQLGVQVASVLPSLLVSAGSFLFVTSRGLLGLILVTLSSSSSSLSLSLALCIMPCNMSAFTSSMTGPSLLCTENRFGRLLELFNRTVHSDGQRVVAAFADFIGFTLSLCTCLLHSFGCFCDGFSRSRPCCDLPAACLPPLFAGWQGRTANEPLVSESAPPCPVSVHLLPDHHELRLTIRQRSWWRARHLCGFLVYVFGILYANFAKLIGCRPRSPPRLLKSRPSCLPLFALKRGLWRRHAGLDLTCGLV